MSQMGLGMLLVGSFQQTVENFAAAAAWLVRSMCTMLCEIVQIL